MRFHPGGGIGPRILAAPDRPGIHGLEEPESAVRMVGHMRELTMPVLDLQKGRMVHPVTEILLPQFAIFPVDHLRFRLLDESIQEFLKRQHDFPSFMVAGLCGVG
jgi:hypothetical protein